MISGISTTGPTRNLNTGANTAELILEYDDGDRCTHDLVFRTETSGDTTEVRIDGTTTTTGWRAMDRP